MRTYPNILWIFVNLFIFSILIAIASFTVFEIINNKNFVLFFPLIFLSLVIILFYKQFSSQFVYIKIEDNMITIYQPLKIKKILLNLTEIKGYSISEFVYGRNLYSSKSFIFYTANNEKIEFVKLFNLKFEDFLNYLKNIDIVKLGNEPYQTGWYKREYKF
uniref:hypothetical protein n=1 Tax=Flavobacterium sp. TaxID=239 RepID=UPI00404AF4FF